MGGRFRNLPLNAKGYLGCCRSPGSVYAAGKAFFSLFETFWRCRASQLCLSSWEGDCKLRKDWNPLETGEREAAGTGSLHVACL